MDYRIERMSIEEYAHIESMLGRKLKLVGSMYWMRLYPFFYRPLLPFEALDVGSVVPPCRLFGGYQHAVCNEHEANSTINYRVFNETNAYSINVLKSDFRRLVRVGAKRFIIKRILEPDELMEGYKAYIAFYDRTGYDYLSERTQEEIFAKWAKTLFMYDKTIVLGGYAEDGLKAVGVCYWIRDVLWYSTFFADTASLKQHVCDLMLHAVRELAARQDGIHRILAGFYGGGIGPDRYYLLRGCKIERMPARYVFNRLTVLLLKALLPAQFGKLTGEFSVAPGIPGG
jgi:hypothetical protein